LDNFFKIKKAAGFIPAAFNRIMPAIIISL